MQMVQVRKLHQETLFNPLHPKIIMHIFHTVLWTFAMKLTKRILTQMTQVYFFYKVFSSHKECIHCCQGFTWYCYHEEPEELFLSLDCSCKTS